MKNALPKVCSSLKQYLGNGTFIMDIIGFIHTDFIEKFGIPRQSGLIPELTGVIEFLPEYRQPEAFKGLQDFSHIWILWEFNRAKRIIGVQRLSRQSLGEIQEWEYSPPDPLSGLTI